MTTSKKTEISFVVPVYGAPNLIPELCKLLHENIGSITQDYEIILVYDCSPDNSWEVIDQECKKDNRITGVKLSRNFGQHEAITAGLSLIKGEWVVVMDCDLQDRPEDVPSLYQKTKEGFDVVVGRRENRQDGPLKKLSSRAFHSIFRFLTGLKTNSSVANFGIYHHRVTDALLDIKGPIYSFPLLILWLGFNRAEIRVTHSSRQEGRSSYSLLKLIRLASNAMLSFSNRPLYLTISSGMIICVGTFIAATIYFILAINGFFQVSGFATIILSIFFLSGTILFFLGIVGLYIAKTFDNTKGRPLFVIDKMINPKGENLDISRDTKRGIQS